MVGVFNAFLKYKSAQNGLKIGYNMKSGLLITNPGSDFLSDVAVSEQTVINVVLEANMAPKSKWSKTYTI